MNLRCILTDVQVKLIILGNKFCQTTKLTPILSRSIVRASTLGVGKMNGNNILAQATQ